MFAEVLSILVSDGKSIVQEEILDTLHLEHFLEGLQNLRSKGEQFIVGRLQDCDITATDAQAISRQIVDEIELLIDSTGTGKIIIGQKPYEKRYVFFFKQGRSTGLRKVFLPHSLSLPTLDEGTLPRRVKLLLVNLESPRYPLLTAPLGIITLGGYLRRLFGDQVRVEYLDMQLEEPGALIAHTKEFLPDIVGLSIKIGAVEGMNEFIGELTSVRSGSHPMIVLGNTVPTYASDEIHHAFPDVVCAIGKGETAIKALTEHIAFNVGSINDVTRVPNCSFVVG